MEIIAKTNLNRTGSGHPDNIMQFKTNVALLDGAHPVTDGLSIDWQPYSQENINDAVGRFATRKDEFQSLSDDDKVSGHIVLQDNTEQPNKQVSLVVVNMTVGEIKEFASRMQTAIQNLNPAPAENVSENVPSPISEEVKQETTASVVEETTTEETATTEITSEEEKKEEVVERPPVDDEQ